MKLSYFREFLVLSRHLNFSTAAKQLNMTQPGLSRHISRLEKEIGIQMFERNTHSVELTKKGAQFLRGIQKIIDDYDFLSEAVVKGGMEKITIGVPYYGINRYLSNIVSLFESANPKVKISYLPAYPDAIITGLLAKQVDVAVLPKVDFSDSEKLVFQDVFNESIVVLVNKNNPLAEKTGIRINDLKDETLIILQGIWGTALFEEWCKFCRQRGFYPSKKTLEAKTIEEAALSVKPDNGVMLLPEHLKQANISGNVKFIDILDKDVYFPISLVHHPENQNPITKKFIQFYLQRHDR